MADPDFWRKTAALFRRLQPAPPAPGEAQRSSHNGICAWWKPDGWDDGKLYHFFNDGHDIEANKNIERLFRIAAESAAVELGHPGGEVGVFAWLDLLRLQGIYVSPGPLGRILHRISDASAEYCLKCESAAKVRARERDRTGAKHALPDWQETRFKFLQGAKAYPGLYAHWESTQGSWTFRDAGALELGPAAPEAERLFKETTRDAVRVLGRSGDSEIRALSSTLREASQIWLDLMRREKRGFRHITKPRSWVEFRALVEGEGPPVDLTGIPLSKNGGIAHVFKESADLWADLVARDDLSAEEPVLALAGNDPPVSLKLTDQQWDLLRLLVTEHEANGGVGFHLTCTQQGRSLVFGKRSIAVTHDVWDFEQLRRDDLIQFQNKAKNYFGGKVTQRGIDAIHRSRESAENPRRLESRAADPTETLFNSFTPLTGSTSSQSILRPEDWEDIELFFVGDHDVEIRMGKDVRKLNYKDIQGFEDRRTGNPTKLWAMLRTFGMLPDRTMPDDARAGDKWIALQKTIQRTSKALRKHLGMTGDPFPYIRDVGYRARIKITIAPPTP